MLRGTEHILFVDDEEVLTRLSTQALAQVGYIVTSYTSSLTALEAFRSAPESFDLLITDYTMPEMTGEALSHALRHIRPDLPIIMGTGFNQAINAERAMDLGIDAFYMKPSTLSELTILIRRVLTQRQGTTSECAREVLPCNVSW